MLSTYQSQQQHNTPTVEQLHTKISPTTHSHYIAEQPSTSNVVMCLVEQVHVILYFLAPMPDIAILKRLKTVQIIRVHKQSDSNLRRKSGQARWTQHVYIQLWIRHVTRRSNVYTRGLLTCRSPGRTGMVEWWVDLCISDIVVRNVRYLRYSTHTCCKMFDIYCYIHDSFWENRDIPRAWDVWLNAWVRAPCKRNNTV